MKRRLLNFSFLPGIPHRSRTDDPGCERRGKARREAGSRFHGCSPEWFLSSMVFGFLVRRRKHDALLGAQVVLASAGGFDEVLSIVCQGTVGTIKERGWTIVAYELSDG